MTLNFKTTALLDGEELPVFKDLYLHQKIHAPNSLEVRIPLSALKNKEYHELLAKPFSLEVLTNNQVKETIGRLEFNGIITAINIINGSGGQGDEIIVRASSKDIVANEGPHYNCYHEMGLNDIIKKTLEKYNFELQVDSTFTETIAYTVQNHESSYNFVKRLSEKYGQWLYYNGKKLVFGKPETNSTPLKYHHDLRAYEIRLNPTPQKFKYFTQNYSEKSGKEWNYTESKKPKGLAGDNAQLFKKSDELFKNETNVWVNANNEAKTENILKAKAKAQRAGFAIRQVEVSGQSWNSGVALGNIVEIKDQKYRIIELVHSLNGINHYENSFEAVSAGLEGYPYTNINAFSSSQSQIAVVKDNNDPEQLGRIKVAFAWQELLGEMTPWIRVLTPHAGESQGIQFIPEIGDQVLVDFEGGDAESPYVIGSLYHAGHKPDKKWNSEDNNIKIIRTRSGHSIELDDTAGEEKIKIYDSEGNAITIDTKEKSLYIEALENIEISAKNVSIIADYTVKIAAQKDVEINAEGKMAMQSTKDTTVKSGKNLQLEATSNATLKGIKSVVKGDTEAELSGGAKAKVSGGAMTEVAGGIIKLN